LRTAIITLLVAAAVMTTGCGAVKIVTAGDGDPGVGKKLFVANCGSCHTLADAGTKGVVGPNLDYAFAYDKKQGFDEQTIRDVVRGQIAYAELNPGTGTRIAPTPGMPPNLVNGQDAKDVSVYVAKCAAVNPCLP
jgi:mono/diheme cytochrome c family protein